MAYYDRLRANRVNDFDAHFLWAVVNPEEWSLYHCVIYLHNTFKYCKLVSCFGIIFLYCAIIFLFIKSFSKYFIWFPHFKLENYNLTSLRCYLGQIILFFYFYFYILMFLYTLAINRQTISRFISTKAIDICFVWILSLEYESKFNSFNYKSKCTTHFFSFSNTTNPFKKLRRRNKPMSLWSITLWKRGKKHKLE